MPLMQLSEHGCQFLWERKIGCTKGVVGSSSGSSWQTMLYIYLLGTTIKLSMLFQVLHGVVVAGTLERILFFDLGLAVTEINTKKV